MFLLSKFFISLLLFAFTSCKKDTTKSLTLTSSAGRATPVEASTGQSLTPETTSYKNEDEILEAPKTLLSSANNPSHQQQTLDTLAEPQQSLSPDDSTSDNPQQSLNPDDSTPDNPQQSLKAATFVLPSSSLWSVMASNSQKNIGTAFAIAPNQFITSFRVFNLLYRKNPSQEILLSNNKGETLVFKQVLKIDMALDLVLFESQSLVESYIDLNLFLPKQDYKPSQDFVMKSYTNNQLTTAKKNGAVREDDLFYRFPTNQANFANGGIGSPLFSKDGTLIAIPVLSDKNIVFALKAKYLKQFINNTDPGINCVDIDIEPCIAKGLDYLNTQVEQGMEFANYNLNHIYYKDINIDKAISEFKKIVETNNPQTKSLTLLSANELASFYLNRQDPNQAIDFLKIASLENYSPAQLVLGTLYLVNGQNKESLEQFKLSATGGYAPAQFTYGIVYIYGQIVSQDLEYGVQWIRLSASNNYDLGEYHLGIFYRSGLKTEEKTFIEKDLNQAIEWITSAANKGVVEAQNTLGEMYLKGEGVKQSDQQAVYWFRKGIDKGYSLSFFNLGWMYLKSLVKENGLPPKNSLRQAYIYLHIARHKISSENNLAQSDITPEDIINTIRELEINIKPEERVMAQHDLGIMYFEGQGVAQNMEMAKELFTQASNEGFAPSQHSLAIMNFEGWGMEKNLKMANELFKKAANQGFAPSQYYLGTINFSGIGLEKRDIKKGINWIKQATEQNHPLALFTYGFIHWQGVRSETELIITPNLITAYYYITLALDKGVDKVETNEGLMTTKYILRKIKDEMSKEDLKTAEDRITKAIDKP